MAIAKCGDGLQNVYATYLQSNTTGLTLLSIAVFPSHQAKNRLAYTLVNYWNIFNDFHKSSLCSFNKFCFYILYLNYFRPKSSKLRIATYMLKYVFVEQLIDYYLSAAVFSLDCLFIWLYISHNLFSWAIRIHAHWVY